ncbi:hypothetical protein [Pseudobacteriovorax antillogorgiicola]|uniref:hypothetical protein n=1 Tax=Pseudobacteriovorax antillogorgiicola TaxID=1513793 RepID=UPI00135651E3|nr:hypothetical protein [Pseudobacteriovorax antillogorgiicola]
MKFEYHSCKSQRAFCLPPEIDIGLPEKASPQQRFDELYQSIINEPDQVIPNMAS